MVGKIHAVAGVQRDGVLAHALQRQAGQICRRLRRQAGKALIVARRAPLLVPAGAEQHEVRAVQVIALQQGQSNGALPPAVHHHGGTGELRRVIAVQRRTVTEHMGRGVHVGAGMGEHMQQRLPVAALVDRAGGGQPGLLRAGIHRHIVPYGVGQLMCRHASASLSCVCSQISSAATSAGDTPDTRPACPTFKGRRALSFSRASSRRP